MMGMSAFDGCTWWLNTYLLGIRNNEIELAAHTSAGAIGDILWETSCGCEII